MGMSSREILLVLRARDEASRTIGRVSSAMSKADRNATQSAMRSVQQNERMLQGMRRQVHDIEYAYRDQTLAARQANIQGKLNAEQYRKAMFEAQRLRTDQQESLRQVRQRTEDLIATDKEHIRAIEQQRELQRDQGRHLMANGTAAVAAGAAMTYFGAMGTAAYVSQIKVAMDYETQVARTFSQVDKGQASLQQIRDLGIQVADELPAKFEEIQPAIYDIFSSIDVGYKGASKLVKQFAKDSVAGSTSMEVAGRANLAILNAYNISAKDASEVSDFMFRLVQKGVGTYEEFAKTIGSAIPSAVRAGQSYETLGSMIAFLTRNGMSAARATTSSGRALDAITNSGTVAKLKKLNIEVLDMKGNFLPLPKILDGINNKMKGLKGESKRANFLQELFKGSGGTIQARRFFDSYFKDAKGFNKMTRMMADSAGIAQKKFELMAESPQYKLQQLINDWMILRREIGLNLMPTVLKVAGTLNDMLDAWQELSPEVRKNIELFAGALLVLLTLAGVFTIVAGAIMIVVGGAAALGVTVGGLIAIFAGVIVAIGALIAAGVLLYQHWDQVAPKLQAVKDKLIEFVSYLRDTYGPTAQAIWDQVSQAATDAFDDIKQGWQNFKDSVNWDKVKSDLQAVQDKFKGASDEIKIVMQALGTYISTELRVIGLAFQVLGKFLGPVFEGLVGYISEFVTGAIDLLTGCVDFVTGLFHAWHGLLTGDWQEMWNGLKQMTSGAVDAIIGFFKMMVKAPYRLVRGLVEGVIDLFKELYDVLVGHSIVPDMANEIVNIFAQLPGRVAGALASLPGQVFGIFESMAEGALSRAQGMVDSVAGKLAEIAGMKAPSVPGLGASGSGGKGGGRGGGSSWRMGLGPTTYGGGVNRDQWIRELVKDVAARAPQLTKDLKPVFGKVFESLLKDLATEAPRMASVVDMASDIIDKRMDKVEDRLQMRAKKAARRVTGTKGDARKAAIAASNAAKGALERYQNSRDNREKGLLSGVVKATSKDLKQLKKVAAEYRKTVRDLDNAKDELKRLQDARADLISSTSQDVVGFGGFSGLTKPTDVFGNESEWTAGNISSQLQAKLEIIRKYGANLDWILQNYGSATYRMVLAMGIMDGAPFAEALVKATPSEISSIKNSVNQVNSWGSIIGTKAGDEMYAAGIAAAEGLIKGLEAKEKELKEIANNLGLLIAKEIKKALKMKSPSKVGIGIGFNFVRSISDSMEGETPRLSQAANAMADAMRPTPEYTYSSSRPPVVGGTPGPGGTNVQKQITVPVTINTNEIDPRATGAAVGWEIAQKVDI